MYTQYRAWGVGIVMLAMLTREYQRNIWLCWLIALLNALLACDLLIFLPLSLVIFLRLRFTWFFSYLFGHSCLASFISAKSSSVSPLNILVPEPSFPIKELSWATPFSPLASINIWVLMTYKCVSTADTVSWASRSLREAWTTFNFWGLQHIKKMFSMSKRVTEVIVILLTHTSQGLTKMLIASVCHGWEIVCITSFEEDENPWGSVSIPQPFPNSRICLPVDITTCMYFRNLKLNLLHAIHTPRLLGMDPGDI